MSYAKGYAAGQADSYWYHSWASRAVSVRDAVARLAALRQLSRVRETAYYEALLPADRAYLDQTISQALRGDLTRLRESAATSGPGG